MNDTINRYLAIFLYPFVSLNCFWHDPFEEFVSEINTKSLTVKKRCQAECKIQEDIVNYMRVNYTIYSYDELYLYLEKCYLYDFRIKKHRTASELYFKCFQKISRSMISQRDGKIVFKYWENENDKKLLGGFGGQNKIFFFHSLNMHIPMDFIVMLYIVQNPENKIQCLDHYYNQIEVADQQLSVILQKGVAENHLHKGVSLSFLEIWEAFMQPMSASMIRRAEKLKFTVNNGLIEPNELLFYIFSASVIRILLVFKLTDKDAATYQGIEEAMELWKNFRNGIDLKQIYRQNFCDVQDDKLTRHKIIAYFQKLWDDLLFLFSQSGQELQRLSSFFFVPDDVCTSEENVFLYHMMKYYYENYKNEKDLEAQEIIKQFLQYLRIKNFFFSISVQKKTIRGLDYFQKEFYTKDSAFNNMSRAGEEPSAYWEKAMRKQFQNGYLKKIEFRASINTKENEFRKNIKNFLCAYQKIIQEDYCTLENGSYKVRAAFPRVGLVFHLIKTKDAYIPEKCLLDGRYDTSKIQYGDLEKGYLSQIQILCTLRNEIRGLDRYIVGLDAASLENAAPVWAFVYAYERARDSGIERVGYYNNKFETGIQSLKFTFHAGEDFRHILSGLRRMDEAVTFLKFHAGDRIGHGTALGIEPEQWKRYNPVVVIPRMEALENYVWAYHILSQDNINFQSTIMAYIEQKAHELAKEIFGECQGLTMTVLIESYIRMFSFSPEEHYKTCEDAWEAGFCENVREKTCDNIVWNSWKVVMARHCKKFLLEMERPVNYEVSEQDITITKTIQDILKKQFSTKGIVVEVNPSSNVSIGEVDRLTENQIFNLNGVNQEHNVMVCINSDDPTVFNTNVSNELSYIYYAMLYHSVSREAALEWIDKIRRCGMESSFIRNDETDQQVYEKLESIIKKL